jgi:hypothetical protein
MFPTILIYYYNIPKGPLSRIQSQCRSISTQMH